MLMFFCILIGVILLGVVLGGIISIFDGDNFFSLRTVIYGAIGGGAALIILVIFVLSAQITTSTSRNKVKFKREALEYALSEQNGNLIALVDEIVDFNSEVDTYQMESKSIWLNWFADANYKDIEKIELPRSEERR